MKRKRIMLLPSSLSSSGNHPTAGKEGGSVRTTRDEISMRLIAVNRFWCSEMCDGLAIYHANRNAYHAARLKITVRLWRRFTSPSREQTCVIGVDCMKKEESWELICQQVKKGLRKKKVRQKISCKNCIWANRESGRILCTRNPCVKENLKWNSMDKPSTPRQF